MALTALENRYLDSMAERQFPTLSPMESAQVMGEQQDAMPADAPMQLAAGPSATVSDADPYANRGYGEIKATPRNRVVGGIADFVRNVRSMADQYEIKDWVPLLGGMGVGELLIGKAPEEIEEWAYGNAPMRVPEMSNVPVMKTGRKEQLADTLFLGLDAAGIGKGVGVAGKGAARYVAPKANELLSEYMQRSGLQSNLMAYHGTPHRFDKFDSSKIGTGEGAQAYGHGLYFAESPDVAKAYTSGFNTDAAEVFVSGKKFEPKTNAEKMAVNAIKGETRSIGADPLKAAEDYFVQNMPDVRPEVRKNYEDALSVVKSLQEKKAQVKGGNLFTVDIPDEVVSKMLDFDAPLGQQSPEIQALAKQYNLSMDDLGGDLLAVARGKTPAGAQALREAGIPGVRYLDQGSRGTGDGTRNLVVFPGGEDQIKIIKTEGTK
jgi:hypothetical protein